FSALLIQPHFHPMPKGEGLSRSGRAVIAPADISPNLSMLDNIFLQFLNILKLLHIQYLRFPLSQKLNFQKDNLFIYLLKNFQIIT
ncbi:hypothetical protein, partial [Bacillus thuringiensis]